MMDFEASVIDSAGFEKPNWIKAQRLPKLFMEEATFVESNLPPVLVNQPEINDLIMIEIIVNVIRNATEHSKTKRQPPQMYLKNPPNFN